MGTTSSLLGLTLPGDGGPGEGGDDLVDVTVQITNNLLALEMGVGLQACTSSLRPSVGNFNGRLIHETDTGKVLVYRGGTFYAFSGPIQEASGGSASTANTWTSYTDTGTSIIVPDPGYYKIRAEGIYNISTTASVAINIAITGAGNGILATSGACGGLGSFYFVCFSETTSWLGSPTTTLKVRGITSSSNGIQLLTNSRIQVTPCAGPKV